MTQYVHTEKSISYTIDTSNVLLSSILSLINFNILSAIANVNYSNLITILAHVKRQNSLAQRQTKQKGFLLLGHLCCKFN